MPVSFAIRSLSCVSDFDHGTGRRKNFGGDADEENFLFSFFYLVACGS